MHYFEAESQKFFCGGGTAPSTAPPLPKLNLLRRLQRLAPYLPTPSYFLTILTLGGPHEDSITKY